MSERSRKILARFVPQVWVRDYAEETGDAFLIDVTDRVIAMGRTRALEVTDCSDASDDLVADRYTHSGPYAVQVADAILEYFKGEETR